MVELVFEKETYAIRGAVFEVYREMGCGFLEAVYQECLEKELRIRGINFVSQAELRHLIKVRYSIKFLNRIWFALKISLWN